MTKAEKRIRATIREHNLIERGDHVVIGLSGGPDSVCMFHVLLSLAEEMELTVHAVHVNHRFRPGAAERDQEYVENLCRRYGVSEKSYEIDCNELAERLGMTSEEAGRKARYDSFFDTAEAVTEEFGGGSGGFAFEHVKIAVAQNAGDQAETILFRILRGSGTDGLAGIAYERSERRGGRTYKVIRPLLDTRREDIEAYCEKNGLDPVTDHTNNEEIYSRNRIRLDLIPYLEEKYNENIKDVLCRLGRNAAADREYFRQETAGRIRELRILRDSAGRPFGEDRVVLDRAGLAGCHKAVRHRIMFRAFAEIGLEQDITAERLAAADSIIEKKQAAKTVEFPRGYSITVVRGRVIFDRSGK